MDTSESVLAWLESKKCCGNWHLLAKPKVPPYPRHQHLVAFAP
jgi:hypothetical protein